MGIEAGIPKTYDEITLGQVMRYNLLPMGPVQIVQNFCTGDFGKMTMAEVEMIADTVTEILAEGHSFFTPFLTLFDPVEERNVNFGMIPNLDQITVGEFLDLSTFCETPNETAHKAMAVLYRPIPELGRVGRRYTIEPYDSSLHQSRCELFKSIPYSHYLGSIAFFLQLLNHYANNSNRFSLNQWKKLKKNGVISELKKLIETSGDGTTPS